MKIFAKPWTIRQVFFLAAIVLCVVILAVLSALSKKAPATVAAEVPKAVEQAAPPSAPQTAPEPEIVVEQKVEPVAPASVAQSAPTQSLPMIMSITQIGGGELIKGWEIDPGYPAVNTGSVTFPIITGNRDWDGIHKKDGNTITLIASPGSITVFKLFIRSFRFKVLTPAT